MTNKADPAEIWTAVHNEPAALIDDLEDLTEEQWDLPSLCDGWTVHDVAAHLVDPARTTRLGFLASLVRARFDFDRLNDRGVSRERASSPRGALDRLRRVAPRTSTPPGPLDSRIVEEIVHGEDIRRSHGITRAYPPQGVIRSIRLPARPCRSAAPRSACPASA